MRNGAWGFFRINIFTLRVLVMKKLMNLVAGLAAAALLCTASTSPSHAATTSFVSGAGNDGNPCTHTQPCRSIGHAIGIAGNGGEVSCLDAGPYTEAFNSSTGSFTVDCKGIVYTGTYAFSLQTGGNNLVVFRNIIFDGAAGGTGAIQQGGGGSVVLENCTFQNFTAASGSAVNFVPGPGVATGYLTITDSTFSNNSSGLVIGPTSRYSITEKAVIERTLFANNGTAMGIFTQNLGVALVEVRYSTIANSVSDGIDVVSGSQVSEQLAGGVASIVVEHSAVVQNGGNGISVGGSSAYASLSDSTVDWNATGLSGGTVLSYKNNMIAGNLSPGVTPVGFNQQ
jgi:hypothetical protein